MPEERFSKQTINSIPAGDVGGVSGVPRSPEKPSVVFSNKKVKLTLVGLSFLGVAVIATMLVIHPQRQQIPREVSRRGTTAPTAPVEQVEVQTTPGEKTKIVDKDAVSPEQKLANRIVDEKSIRPQLTSGSVALGYVERSLLGNPSSNRIFPFNLIPKVFAQSLPKTVVLFYTAPDHKTIWAYDVLLEQKFKIYESEDNISSLIFNSERKSVVFISYIYTKEICKLMLNEYSLKTKSLSLINENDICKFQHFSLSHSEEQIAFAAGDPDRLVIYDLTTGEYKESSPSAAGAYTGPTFWSHDDDTVFFCRALQMPEGSITSPIQIFKHIVETGEEERVTNSEDKFDFKLFQVSKDDSEIYALVGDVIDFTKNFDEYKEGKSYIQFGVYDIKKEALSLYPDTFGASWTGFLLDENDKNAFLIIHEDNPAPYKLAHLNLEKESIEIVYTANGLLRVLGWNGTDHNILLVEFGIGNTAKLLDYDTTTKTLQIIGELEDIYWF